MAKIMLLTSVYGDGPVFGDPGEVRDVPNEVARIWADGARAEHWRGTTEQQEFRVFHGHTPKLSKDA